MKLISKTAPVTHEDLFLERYERLSVWALQMTGNHELAEDLVQDAFIQFTFSRSDLAAVRNLDAYLYGLLRNLHLSQVRRSARSRLQPMSIVEYESAEMGLCAADQRDQIRAQDELRQICHYACLRKETAWIGSVLILRFFHGYYPSEIAKILRTTRKSVDERLRLARAEARLSLANPGSLSFMKETTVVPFGPAGFARQVNEFLIELREMIFHSRQGRCFSTKQLQTLYATPDASSMRSESLGHIVSCRTCLDTVNKLLGLPRLAERYPTDTIGRDQSRRGGKGGGDDGGHGIGGGITGINRWRRRARETFEHRPKELHISVNGVLQGSQKINAELNEQTIDIDMTEQIGFVEVFSELGIRLLMLNADEPPPRGAVEQLTQVELSDRRSLELKLRFDSPWPTLHVAYVDPLMRAGSAEETAADAGPASGFPVVTAEDGTIRKVLRSFWPRSVNVSDLTFWLRPGMVTMLIAILLAAALLIIRTNRPEPILTSAELLRQSTAREAALAANSSQVLHRTISLEERKGGELIALRKIEEWYSGERGITARRLYDNQGRLVAGDWRRRDGAQTLYQHAAQPRIQLPPEQRALAKTFSFDDAWQLSPSAKGFTALIGDVVPARMQESANRYVVTYDQSSSGANQGPRLVKASLTVSKTDLHATELTLVLDDEREFHFVETSFELRARSAVAPAVFEPDSRLLPIAESAPRSLKPDTDAEPPTSPPAVTASSALEVQVLRQLDQAGALYGEQINLSRTVEGRLVVQGIVDSSKRKAEIRQALGAFLANPAVRFEVETAEEAAQRQARRERGRDSTSVTTIQIEQERATPADADLRPYFSSKGIAGAQLDQEVRRFSDRVLAHSRQARRHALALKQIVERFSADDLSTMDDASRDQWRRLIEQHARSIQEETESLRRELQPIFFPGVGGGSNETSSDLVQSTKQLFEIVISNDDLVRRSFTLGESRTAAVKSAQFARNLGAALGLCEKIVRGY